MAAQTLEGHYDRPVPVDWCSRCGALWFDGFESVLLTPGSVLKLFTLINAGPAEARAPLPDTLACPRCRAQLAATTDMQRGTRFHYWRCPAEHGRFTAFAEFLREKNFVRPLGPAEVADLRRHVQMVQCSSCGAPVDLAAGSICGHCRAPVSMLDPRQVESVVRELQQAEEKRKTEDPTVAARLMMDRLEVDRLFRDRASLGLDDGSPVGVIEAGIAALAGLLGALE